LIPLLKSRVKKGMDFTQILAPFADHPWVQIATAVVTLASALAAVTKKPESGWGAKAYFLIDFLALNVFRAKDK
jgi:hypothetical protein